MLKNFDIENFGEKNKGIFSNIFESKLLNMIFYAFAYIIVFIFVINQTNATQIQKISINPNNRINIYLDEEITYISELSADKQKVEIQLNPTFFQDNVKDIIVNNGIISSVSTFSRENKTIISILLSKQLGYTANYLPYSKSILIEVFDWKSLKPSEDALRQGLLSLESGLVDDALNNFNTSSQLKSANGTGFLGLTQLVNNNENEGYRNLISAFEIKTDIADVYAALAQIYKAKNEVQIANKFSKIFTNLTGITYFDELSFNNDTISLITNLNLNYLEQFSVESTPLDTNNLSGFLANDTTKTDTAKAQAETISEMFIPEDFFKYLGVMMLFAIGIGIIIYLSKRKKKEKILNAKDKFKSSLNNAINEIDPEKFNKQKEIKRNLFINKKEIEKKHKNANSKPVKKNEPKPKINLRNVEPINKNIEVKNVELENNTEKLQNFLEGFIEAKKREESQLLKNKINTKAQKRQERENLKYSDIPQTEEFKRINFKDRELLNKDILDEIENSQTKSQIVDDNENIEKAVKLDPKADLAMRIAQKQKEIENEKLGAKNNNASNETFSRNISIEKSGSETQEKLKNIENDENLRNKLLNKFKNNNTEE